MVFVIHAIYYASHTTRYVAFSSIIQAVKNFASLSFVSPFLTPRLFSGAIPSGVYRPDPSTISQIRNLYHVHRYERSKQPPGTSEAAKTPTKQTPAKHHPMQRNHRHPSLSTLPLSNLTLTSPIVESTSPRQPFQVTPGLVSSLFDFQQPDTN